MNASNEAGSLALEHRTWIPVAMSYQTWMTLNCSGKTLSWEVDDVLRPRIDTLFSPTAIGSLEMGGSVENPILLDDEEDKENWPATTPVSERPNRPPASMRSRAFGTRFANVPEFTDSITETQNSEIASTKSKYNLCTHYYKDIIEHSNTQIPLSIRFENNKSCVFFIKKFELHRNQLSLTEIVNHIHSET